MGLRARWNPGPVLAALLLGLLTPLPSAAQYTFGRVEGIILDPTGATISGTAVRLQHLATETARSFSTGAEGVYVFFAVPPGNYRLSAEAPGFATKSAQFNVSSNQTVTVNLTLGVSAGTTRIEVRGEPGALDVTDAQHSHTLSATELALLPNLPRNMITTVTLAPGVQPTNNPRGGSTFGGGTPGFAVTLGVQSGLISANGGRAYASSVQLDYTDANDWQFGGFGPAMQAISPDMLEEFKLLTSNFSAEYGVGSNAQVIMVTKSGTNRWHGTAYDYLQNDLFNARDYFDVSGQASKLKQNIYGFTMGGPAVKDRNFLFGGYERRQTRGASFTNLVGLPTLQARARASDPIIINLMSQFLPVPPTNTGDLGTVVTQIPSPVDNYQFIVKTDHRFSDAHVLSARYVQGTASFVARFPSSNLLPGFDGDDEFALRNVNLTDSYSLNPRAVNELRLAYGYDRGTVGTQNGLLTPRFQITGLVNFGALERLPTNRTFNVYQVNDVLNLMRGSHVLKMGVDARKIQDNSRSDTNSRGVFTFPSLNAFLNAQPSNWTELFGSTQRAFRTGLYGFFLQDDWKVRKDLTLNLGFRWDVQGALSEAHGLTSVLDPGTPGAIGAAGSGPLGSFRVGSPAVNSNPVLPAPRLGFAWNPHHGNFVLRGGYGIYWDSFTFGTLSLSRFAPPLNYNLTLTGSQISGANSFDNLYNGTAPVLAQGASQVGSFGNLLNFGFITTVDPNLRNAYIQDFTLGAEYQLRSYVIALSYIGTKGTHLTKLVPINPVNPVKLAAMGAAPATSLADETARLAQFQQAFGLENGVGNIRLDPHFDQVNLQASTSGSIYHSLQAEVRKSFTHGLQFQAAYTWSRAIDDASDFDPSILANDSSFPQSATNPAGERAPSDFDIAHRLIVTSIWRVPFFRHLHGAAGKILDGWGFESSNLWQTGLPATLLAGPRLGISDVNLDGNTVRSGSGLEDNTRANCAPAGVSFTLGNPAAVTGVSQPLLGNNGTCGRNSTRMPGLTNFDWALSKDFRLAESGPMGSGPWELQFRTEALNVFNIPFLTATGNAWRTVSTPRGPNFAKINNAGSTRKLQFALKLIW